MNVKVEAPKSPIVVTMTMNGDERSVLEKYLEELVGHLVNSEASEGEKLLSQLYMKL